MLSKSSEPLKVGDLLSPSWGEVGFLLITKVRYGYMKVRVPDYYLDDILTSPVVAWGKFDRNSVLVHFEFLDLRDNVLDSTHCYIDNLYKHFKKMNSDDTDSRKA